LIILDRGHPAQTPDGQSARKPSFHQKNPCRACRLRTRAVSDSHPGKRHWGPTAGDSIIRNPNHSL